MANKGKNSAADRAKTLIAGTQKHLANGGQLQFAGGVFTPAQVVDELEQLATLRADVDASRAATRAKVAVEREKAPALYAFMSAYVQFLRNAFGSQVDVLADFGVPPKKVRTPPTVEQKAAAAAKRDATRAARGTKSAKAKRGIKGAVIGVVVTPVVAPQPAPVPADKAPAAPTAAPAAGVAPGGTPHIA
jgi:hypothetical protein